MLFGTIRKPILWEKAFSSNFVWVYHTLTGLLQMLFLTWCDWQYGDWIGVKLKVIANSPWRAHTEALFDFWYKKHSAQGTFTYWASTGLNRCLTLSVIRSTSTRFPANVFITIYGRIVNRPAGSVITKTWPGRRYDFRSECSQTTLSIRGKYIWSVNLMKLMNFWNYKGLVFFRFHIKSK